MRLIRPATAACSLMLASCAGYVRHHEPAATVSHGRTCDLVYEVKTRRAAVDLVPGAGSAGSGLGTGPGKITITNHGVPFGIFPYAWRSDPWKDWATIRTGGTYVLEVPRDKPGFQASAVHDRTDLSTRTPIRATITFHGLPADIGRKDLIEVAGDL